MLVDVLRAVTLAVQAPPQPGVRVFNVVGRDSNSSDPIPSILRASLGSRGEQLDLSAYDSPDHAYDALFTMDAIRTALGFSPQESTRTPTTYLKEE
jgi:nucleoside-diphosphate-sugar epimerase